MHQGIIRSALTGDLPLELDYREPSAPAGKRPAEPVQEESSAVPRITNEFERLLLTL